VGSAEQVFEFGEFHPDAANKLLLRAGEIVPLTPKAFDVLLALVESGGGRTLSKDELMRAAWPETFVEEANPTVNIRTLRKALGENGDGRLYIKTVPKRGYRFTAAVKELRGLDAEAESHSPLRALGAQAINLPSLRTPLIGREADVRGLERLLREESICLLTLTGKGGIGKTRLSLQAAVNVSEEFPDGLFFVALAPSARLVS
jgi:DNA-binding winged helix-turn-helix (wHTH) protein